MRNVLTARNVTVALSAALLAGFALAEAAHAISSAAFRYSTPQTGYLMVPPSAFVPDNVVDNYNNSGGGVSPVGGGGACFTAPVNLPQGAKMTTFAMWYSKGDNIGEVANLMRVSPSDAVATLVAQLTTTDTGGQRKPVAVTIANPALRAVNNRRYFYFVSQCLSPAEIFFGARIAYTYKTAGD